MKAALRQMKNIILMPWYIMQILSTAKSFKSNPILGNRILNTMGLHVMRVILSHGIMRFRMSLLSFSIPKYLQKAYYKNGYILLENVLPEERFDRLLRESQNIRSTVRECIQGDTLTQRIHLNQSNAYQVKEIYRFLKQKDIVKLLKFAAGKNHRPVSHIQVIKNQFAQGGYDPQKILHSDTFHPTMKYWYFLQDVGEGMAPFTYVEGSNRLTWKRIKWEYNKSINIDKETSSYSQKGSFRIEENALSLLGLPEPKKVCVSKNTLVIVNTFGFHRRGEADAKSMRAEIWGISRTNPFNPFVGFDFSFLHDFENWRLNKLREIKDKEALKEGKTSSWHVIESENIYDV